MAQTTPKMGLAAWDQPLDPYNYQQFANNWNIVDFHDHSPGRGVQIPLGGLAPGAVGATNIATGAITGDQLSSALGQSASVNQTGQTVKGAVNIVASHSTSSTTFTTLATPDQVPGIVLPPNGILVVWYQATWQESISGAARAAIFLGANEIQLAQQNAPSATFIEAQIGGTAAKNVPLATTAAGLGGPTGGTGYSGDVTTGQVIGAGSASGPTYLFAAAGTYTISVQFKASSGSVTVSNRRLWVEARSSV